MKFYKLYLFIYFCLASDILTFQNIEYFRINGDDIEFVYKKKLYRMKDNKVIFSEEYGPPVHFYGNEYLYNAPPDWSARFLNQGWKIHISAFEETAEDIFDAIAPILIEYRLLFKIFHLRPYEYNGVQHKYTLPPIKFDKIHFAALFSILKEQIGKFICIYFADNDFMKETVILLDKALQKFKTEFQKINQTTKHPFIPLYGDLQVGDSGGVYARYGVFVPLIGNKLYQISPENYKFAQTENFRKQNCAEWFELSESEQRLIISTVIYDHDEQRYACYTIKKEELKLLHDYRGIPLNCQILKQKKSFETRSRKVHPQNVFEGLTLKFRGKRISWENICRIKLNINTTLDKYIK